MRRREFVAALGGLALARASAARAQQAGRARTVGILMPYPETDAEVQDRVAAFRQELQRFGWRTGENLRVHERWATDDMGRVRAAAAELVAAKPDVILATGARVMPVLQQQTRSVPVVFVATSDPIGRGLVASLARPGGNMTGFALSELPIIEKLLDVLKQIAPGVRRVAFIYNPDNPASPRNIEAFNDTAAKFSVEPVIAPIRQPAEIERTIESMARQPNGGALFPSDLTILAQRDLAVAAAARHRLPAVYADRAMVAGGGLISFSPDRKHMFQLSAGYVDRILRGESPAELPVQQPTKYELVLNLKTAQGLGLEVSPALLFQADEVIE
jgi:putative tryptophan/tyrosine transport system substrate-binding protein